MKKAARAALFDPGKEENLLVTSVQEDQSNSDAYWVGALAMTCARAQHLIAEGTPEIALNEIDNTLNHLAHSPVMDDGLKDELAAYWKPREESR